MEFVTNYWVVLLVLFILLLLIALSYLIDREIKKMKDSDVDSDIKDNEIEEITDDTEDEYTSKIDDIVNVQMDNIKEIDNNTDSDNTNIVEIDSRELDYDELDVPDIEEDFNIQWSNTDYSFEDRDHARAMLATKGKFVGYNGKEVIFQTQTPWSDFCNGGGTYKLIEETSGLYKYGDEIK